MLNPLVLLIAAQVAAAPFDAQLSPEVVQTTDQAFAQDAIAYAARYTVSPEEAVRRLRAQEESVPAVLALQQQYRARLAGISVEHQPDFRIVFLLTGDDPVKPERITVGGLSVPIEFRTGALATRDAMVDAMRRHQDEMRAVLPTARGIGIDQRAGAIVLLITSADAARIGVPAIQARARAAAGVPVRVEVSDARDVNLAVAGGARIVGTFTGDSQKYLCTSGFVVVDGTRTGVVTAAHCPDDFAVFDPSSGSSPLPMVGQWGWGYQDAQIGVSATALKPLFYANHRDGSLRRLTSWRNRTSTRAGDFVCHFGETSGYSCAEVALTDFAPPGELCGGPCQPEWVTVTGASCRGGDSGGPVFIGTTAFGILKGGNRTAGGRCLFYYYMSTDFLPRGWSLLH